VELPTYTNIWKIEKRLYKLYDFRLPMPLPVGQLAVFVAIAVPYMLILTVAGMPFSHTWFWLYVLPPGVLAWLVTRPVLESKRLPELVLSQLRYLSEPRTWCRMAPLAEKDEITVVAAVWRWTAGSTPSVQASRAAGVTKPAPADDREAFAAEAVAAQTAVTDAVEAEAGAQAAAAEVPAEVPGRPVWPGSPAIHAPSAASAVTGPAAAAAERAAPVPAVTEPAAAAEVPVRAAVAAGSAEASERLFAEPLPAPNRPTTSERPPTDRPARERLTTEHPVSEPPSPARPATERALPSRPTAPDQQAPKPPWRPGGKPALTVRTDGPAGQPLHVVERALRSSPGGGAASGWNDRVVVVPGGHRPGKPDQVQRDRARARLPLAGPARIVVLGCTAGAGQTATTLLTGHLLASLRGEAVAVLDLSAGPGSLTEQARQIPRLLPGRRNAARSEEPAPKRERGLQVVTADSDADEPADAGKLVDAVVARYPLTLADPAAAQVPRTLHVADQLVLVAPANPDAASALAMTLEWLDGHGHAELARRAVAVLNGVSANTAAHTAKAAAVATGQCRAIVRVPWDAGLGGTGPLGIAAVQAYTALAGVLVSGMADVAASAAGQSGSVGQ
jgi:MinD-like ATPase involved in chromosome partitioning or flagellar assembly